MTIQNKTSAANDGENNEIANRFLFEEQLLNPYLCRLRRYTTCKLNFILTND